MAHDTEELARELMSVLSERDGERLIALTDPAVEWYSFFAELTEEGVYRGHEGTRRYMRDLDDAWEVARADIDSVLAVGDVAVLVGRLHYRGRGSGAETESAVGWMLEFRDRKLLVFRAFRDPERALAALGRR